MAKLGFPGLPSPRTGGRWPGCLRKSLHNVLCLVWTLTGPPCVFPLSLEEQTAGQRSRVKGIYFLQFVIYLSNLILRSLLWWERISNISVFSVMGFLSLEKVFGLQMIKIFAHFFFQVYYTYAAII